MYRTAPLGKRPRWWTELPLIAVVYGLYSAGRLLVRGDVQSAVDHGLAILDLEKTFRINFEHPLNRLFTGHPALGIPADFAYAALHYLLTPALLVWLFRRRPDHYRRMRTWLMASTLIGLIGFTLLPTCPPRLLDGTYGFVDTMHQYSEYGWWGGDASAPRGLGGLTNQYAAMPSLHVGWALWCGAVLWRHGRATWAKVVGVAYPLAITLVVMGTANHYFLDAVAGAAVMGAGFLLAKPALRLADRIRSRRAGAAPAETTGTPAIVSGGCETAAGTALVRTTSPGSPAGAGRPGAPERLREADASDQIPRQPARGEAGDSRTDDAATAAR
ncbi:phosphatase PAP2 family protein [Streptomyces griseocarneus]|uniref:phosphatase PAP2 family protein n=1 Tax=Streptomyces griseocarneus TaxID=51201 RepID=UPI00167D4AE7|nr:phosphatase PAP2 family protein [Streptomyces griseocarneus]MBZ6477022.1 phosphatase PAP2 family protein [Streptomyces griseocarneus]GHG70002.1 inositol phosphorylceramide synthase [Streptomyces griseocarneus]